MQKTNFPKLILASWLLFGSILPMTGLCRTATAADESESVDEALVLNLAPNWKLANKRHAGNEYVLQYLPAGADLKKPAELITVTTLMEIPQSLDAKTYMLRARKAMEAARQSGTFEWKSVVETAADASCEYTLNGHPKIPDQFEIMRVIRGGEELHSIIYHFGKKAVSGSEKEKAWAVVNSVKLTAAN